MSAKEQYILDERLANAIFYHWQDDEEDDQETSMGIFKKLMAIEKRSRGTAAPFLHRLYGFIHQKYEDAREELEAHNGFLATLPKPNTEPKKERRHSRAVARDQTGEDAFDATAISRVTELGEFEDWILDPISPGEWQSLGKEEEAYLRAVSVNYLSKVHAEIEGARWCRPSFYKNLTFVEVQLSFNRGPVIASMYVSDTETGAFDGSSPIVHELNGNNLLILNDNTVLDYLRFFCLAVDGDEGTFRIVIDGPEIPGWDQLDGDTRKLVSGNAIALNVQPDPEDAGSFRMSACVRYSHALFKTDFRVSENGMVEMVDDVDLVEKLKFSREAFDSQGLRTVTHVES
ncbi:MAG: hypothetical protein AAFR71_15410 [Pseudomonadota bacterium]